MRPEFRIISRQATLLAASLVTGALTWRAADAQIFRQRPLDAPPVGVWAGFGIAYLRPSAIDDGATGARWDFGDAAQYRGTVQFPINPSVAIGGTFTYADVPMLYGPSLSLDAVPRSIPTYFGNARARVTQYFGTLRVGSSMFGRGLGRALEINAGITNFDNFRGADDSKLPPLDGARDFTIEIAPIFTIPISARAQVDLGSDFGWVFHSREGLAGNAHGGSRIITPRAGLRLGF